MKPVVDRPGMESDYVRDGNLTLDTDSLCWSELFDEKKSYR